jgi:hypothetical protein
MELELREAKYRAQTESLKIQLMRDSETKVGELIFTFTLKPYGFLAKPTSRRTA